MSLRKLRPGRIVNKESLLLTVSESDSTAYVHPAPVSVNKRGICLEKKRDVDNQADLPPRRRDERVARILKLGTLLQKSPGTMGATSLCKALDISKRTLHRDIFILRRAGVQIDYSHRDRGYFVTTLGPVLGEILTVREVAALFTCLDGDLPKPGTTFENALEAAKSKLKTSLLGEHQSVKPVMEKTIQDFKENQSRRSK